MRSSSTTEAVRQINDHENAPLAKFFRGLGDPSRMRIVRLLAQHGELTVNQISEQLDIAQPKVSHHIACLRWCGYVFTRTEGRTTFNSVRDPRVLQIIALAVDFARENENFISECERIQDSDAS
jgi:ArsR family transcriptional regulator